MQNREKANTSDKKSIKTIIKSALTDSNILQKSLNDWQKGMFDFSPWRSQPPNHIQMVDQIKENMAFIDAVFTKVCEYLNNTHSSKLFVMQYLVTSQKKSIY